MKFRTTFYQNLQTFVWDVFNLSLQNMENLYVKYRIHNLLIA